MGSCKVHSFAHAEASVERKRGNLPHALSAENIRGISRKLTAQFHLSPLCSSYGVGSRVIIERVFTCSHVTLLQEEARRADHATPRRFRRSSAVGGDIIARRRSDFQKRERKRVRAGGRTSSRVTSSIRFTADQFNPTDLN